MDGHKLALESKSIVRSRTKGKIKLSVEDILDNPCSTEKEQYDFLITSPPYGDNGTTVTYGQFSYLPLKWIDTSDLKSIVPSKLLDNASAIDSASIGGSLRGALTSKDRLSSSSSAFKGVFDKVNRKEGNGASRLTAFIDGMDKSITNMLFRMKSDSYLVWTLGNRRISGVEVPLDSIISELLDSKDCSFVCNIKRKIPHKRMATRNQSVITMNEESILVMRKN